MYLTQALKRSAQVNENGLATKDGNRSFTWKQSMQRISKLAGGLKKLDFKTDERAAILSLNSDRYFEILYAAPWAGGIFVPINTRLAPPEIEFWLNDSESSILFVDKNFSNIAKKLIDNKNNWNLILLSIGFAFLIIGLFDHYLISLYQG